MLANSDPAAGAERAVWQPQPPVLVPGGVPRGTQTMRSSHVPAAQVSLHIVRAVITGGGSAESGSIRPPQVRGSTQSERV